jgi:phosphinothricin acetyltransferase
MAIRRCTPSDGAAIAAIYDPIVAGSTISFEESPPGAAEMRRRIEVAGDRYPWLGFERDGELVAYVYASAHRSRAAYRWSVDVSVYVAPAARRGGVGLELYLKLFEILALQGYASAFAGIALPNEASIRLHTNVGFKEVGTYHRVGYKLGAWQDVKWFEYPLTTDEFEPFEPRSLAELEIER